MAETRFEDARADGPTARTSPEGPDWIENRPSRSWLPHLDLGELWSSREITLVLAQRNIKTRYKQTVLGVAWTILQPLSAVVIFSLVLGRLANVPSDGVPYPVFVYSGLAAWLYMAGASNLASESLAQYRQLVTKVYFPRLHAPLSSTLPGLVDLAISIAAIGVFMAIYDVRPTRAIVFLPLCIVILVLFTFAVGTWLAALNVQYRDVRNALAFMLQLWLFVTPVVYGSSLLEGDWTFVLALNPMAGIIECFRWSLVGAEAPGAWAVVSLAVGLLVLASALFYFGRVQRRFADVI